jgi:hypothetical protein
MAVIFNINDHNLKRFEIFEELITDKELGKSCVCNKNFPNPYPEFLKSIRVIILGADPTNPGKNELSYVFGLENKQSPYFAPILKNLKKLGLGLGDIYVQNLCPNYFEEVTDKNRVYEEIASKYWLSFIIEELDMQFPIEIPVLVTAWKPLVVVAPEAKAFKKKKSEIYTKSIVFRMHKSGRPVLAFFRGGKRHGYQGFYDINFPEFQKYKVKIKSIIS